MTEEAPKFSRYEALLFAALCALTLLLGAVRGASIPFWSDELSTVHISESPSWHQMVERSRVADLNPPLDFSLVRLSFDAFGVNEFAGRLPSVLGFTLMIGCMYLYLRRRVSVPFALFGALLPVYNAQVAHYATEARPYALLLGFLALGILAYDAIVQQRRHLWLARAALLVALSGMLLSHIFGLLAVAAFLAAETVRSLWQRRVDWATWVALLLPLLCCITYIPFFRAQPSSHTLVYSASQRATLHKAILRYRTLLYTPIDLLVAVALALLLLSRSYPRERFRESLKFRAATWTLFAGVLATPILVALVFHFRAPGAGFYERYSLAMIVPAYLLAALFAAWRSNRSLGVGSTLAVIAVVGSLLTFSDVPGEALHIAHRGLLRKTDEGTSAGGVAHVMPNLPLVINDALIFLEADYSLSPAVTRRMVYVTDDAEALRINKNNATESIAGMARTYHLRSAVVPFAQFMSAHHQFLVLGQPDISGWFLKEMMQRGEDVRLLGTYDFMDKNQELWLVTVNAASTPAAAHATFEPGK